MIRNRHIDVICIFALVLATGAACLLAWAGSVGVIAPARPNTYLDLLFDDSRVHTVNIEVEDWDAFIASAPEEEYTQADVVIDGERLTGVGLRAKGNNSVGHISRRGLSRYSLKIEFDHYDRNTTYHGLDKLSLDAAFQDNSYLKNYLTYDMMRFMGVPAPATAFTQVMVNGEPWGLFLAVEDAEDAFADRVWGADHGALYKPDYRSLENENADVALRYIGDDPSLYPGIFDEAQLDVDEAGKRRLIRALEGLASGENLERYVDVDATLRYFAVQVFVANLDSYLGSTGHNYLLYEDAGRISMLPWDYNLAFGTYALGRPELPDDVGTYVNLPIDEPAAPEVLAERPLFTNLMAHEEYRARYHDYLDQLVANYVESGRLSETIARMRELIAPYVAEDPTAFCTYEEFLVGVDTIEMFCLLRAESIRGQLEGAIPPTHEGQRAEPGALVDASAIALEDMGELSDLDETAETGERDM